VVYLSTQKKTPWPEPASDLYRATAACRRSSADFCGYRVPRGQRDGSLRPYSRISRSDLSTQTSEFKTKCHHQLYQQRCVVRSTATDVSKEHDFFARCTFMPVSCFAYSSALTTETYSSATSVNFQRLARNYILEDRTQSPPSELQIRCHSPKIKKKVKLFP
jgi:hypothetical protein